MAGTRVVQDGGGRRAVPHAFRCRGGVGTVYGVYDEDAGVDIRERFNIDPDFVIRAGEVLTAAVGRNPAELVRQVKAFQHVRSTGEVTPSGWEPGDMTLTPGPALVGKVWEVWKP